MGPRAGTTKENPISILRNYRDELTPLRRKRQADVPLNEAVREGLVAGEPKSALAKRLSKAYGVSRAKVYGLALRTSGGCCGQEKSAASTGT